MIPRIYLAAERLAGQSDIQLDSEQTNYLVQALRLKDGDALQVFDGIGHRFVATLRTEGRRSCRVIIGEPATGSSPPSPVRTILLQGLAASERMDWVIEKSVELGVTVIVPVRCARSSVKLDAERASRRSAHWQRITVAACMQSGRDDLPQLAPLSLLTDLLHARPLAPPVAAPALMLVPGASQPLTEWLATHARSVQDSGAMSLLIGPESGLNPQEIDLAARAGFTAVGLGPRILRTETAGLVALSLIQGMLGDLQPGTDPHRA